MSYALLADMRTVGLELDMVLAKHLVVTFEGIRTEQSLVRVKGKEKSLAPGGENREDARDRAKLACSLVFPLWARARRADRVCGRERRLFCTDEAY